MASNNSDGDGDGDGESSASCRCSTCPQDITILFDGGGFRTYLEYHIANYKILRPHISIHLDELPPSSSWSVVAEVSNAEALVAQLNLNDDETKTSSSSSSVSTWDGIIFPAHLTGALIESDRLWDLSDYVQQQLNLPPTPFQAQDRSLQLDWPDMQPFFRSEQAVFDGKVRLIPLDGDLLLMYYRRDLFEEHQIPVPRTWEEYTQAAAFFHGKPWGPGNSKLNGSCVSRVDNCANSFWASLVLSTMTQALGTPSGFLLDPQTTNPILGQAMEETLRILADQSKVGADNELLDMDCLQANFDLNAGSCAMTYNWGNQLTVENGEIDADGQYKIGVAPTPGSTRVLDRETGLLVDCTTEICPYGTFYEDLGIVNRPSYSAFGGWQGGVSNASPIGKQYAMADFLTYMSNHLQSLPDDVLPNPRSSFADPYRYSHLVSPSWVDAGLDNVTVLQYADSIEMVNSQNTVIDIRIRPGIAFREIMDDEVYSYLTEKKKQPGMTSADDALLRSKITGQMDERMRQAISSVGRASVSQMYQASLGVTNTTGNSMNYINPEFRSVGWGLAGLICCTSLALVFWTLWYRRNRVMQAFQPFLLIQSAIGLFFMGGTIIPLGFDDSLFSNDVLDATCMATPWIYVVGFSVFFSSVYSKIKVCLKIFKSPEMYDVLLVTPMDALKGCTRLLLLNGVMLFLWTLLDPLKWVRLEVTDGATFSDGTVETYGACRGENFDILGLALALFFFNLILCLVGTFQAFKCRFLVLEYNEMQWLPLSLFPFFETWIVGYPILYFVNEDPTTTFVVLTVVIAASSIAAALAVFAPKDWYIRKIRVMKENGSNASRSSSAGVSVLKHPTVESQKQMVGLQQQLEQVTAYNNELEIDIRVLKDKFRHLTQREKMALAYGIFREGTSDTGNSRANFRGRGGEDLEPTENTPVQEDELAAMEHFASVWSMPDDDDVDEENIAEVDTHDMNTSAANPMTGDDRELVATDVVSVGDVTYDPGIGEGLSSGAIGGIVTATGTTVGGTIYSIRNRTNEENDQRKEDCGIDDGDSATGIGVAAAGRAVFTASVRERSNIEVGDIVPSDERSVVIINDEREAGASALLNDLNAVETGNRRNMAPQLESYPSPGRECVGPLHLRTSDGELNVEAIGSDILYAPNMFSDSISASSRVDEDLEDPNDVLRRLGKEIELDDLKALESEALVLAEQFKLNSTFLESISDIQTNDDEGMQTWDELHHLDISKIASDTLTSDSTGLPLRLSSTSNDGVFFCRSLLTATTDDTNDTSSSTDQGVSASAGESSGGAVIARWATLELMEDYSYQNAGEPSGDVTYSVENRQEYDDEEDYDDDNHGMKPHLPPKYQSASKNKILRLPDGARSPLRKSISPASSGLDSPLNRSQNNISVVIGDWSAVGATGGLLADLSDSQSTSSCADSYADSMSSMEAAARTSHLDFQMSKEIDQLVARADFEAVKAAAEKFEVMSIDPDEVEEGRNTKIAETKRKKRELEAWRISLSRSFETDLH